MRFNLWFTNYFIVRNSIIVTSRLTNAVFSLMHPDLLGFSTMLCFFILHFVLIRSKTVGYPGGTLRKFIIFFSHFYTNWGDREEIREIWKRYRGFSMPIPIGTQWKKLLAYASIIIHRWEFASVLSTLKAYFFHIRFNVFNVVVLCIFRYEFHAIVYNFLWYFVVISSSVGSVL